jgi:hypothetical protein
MLKIVEYQAKLHGFILPDGCEQLLTGYFTELKRIQGEAWGNGREARKILEQASLQLAERLRNKQNVSKKDVSTLTIADIERAIKFSLTREKAFCDDRTYRIGFGE